MTKHRGRLNLDVGYAEWDSMDSVRVGDRVVPRVISVVFPSSEGQPGLDFEIKVVKGVPRCSVLTIRADDAGREVRSKDVRAVRLEDWLEEIVAAASEQVVSDEGGVTTTVISTSEDARQRAIRSVREARRGGRRKITPELLARVAEVYLAHQDERPVEAVMSAFLTSYRTAARYVQLAREQDPPLIPRKA
jgi:hypothetical protein